MSIYSRFYEFCVPHTDELPLLRDLVAAADGRARILEFGCGTGRLALPLVREGCEVVGLDRDPEMLALARSRAQALPPDEAARLRLVEADVTKPLPSAIGTDAFDLVVISSNTLCVLPTAVDQDYALARACDALRPGGRLFLEQTFIPGFVSQAFRERETIHIETRDNPATGLRTARSMSFAHDPVRQLLLASTFLEEFSADGGSTRYEYQERLRYNHLVELVLRLRLAGFTSPDVYGGCDRRPLTPTSLKFIAIAARE